MQKKTSPELSEEVSFSDVVEHLEREYPAGLITARHISDGTYVGYDDAGFYFSTSIPGVEKYVMIDYQLRMVDVKSSWRIVKLTAEQKEKVLNDRK